MHFLPAEGCACFVVFAPHATSHHDVLLVHSLSLQIGFSACRGFRQSAGPAPAALLACFRGQLVNGMRTPYSCARSPDARVRVSRRASPTFCVLLRSTCRASTQKFRIFKRRWYSRIRPLSIGMFARDTPSLSGAWVAHTNDLVPATCVIPYTVPSLGMCEPLCILW